MAGGKLSPRQKMINLMYLVFIAMLALQMSKEVLTAFGYLNERLDIANDKNIERNALKYDGLAVKANEQPEKFGDINEKAEKIRILSQELYVLIDSIKAHALKDVDEDKQKDYQAMDKSETLDLYFYQKGKPTDKGQAFLDAVGKYRSEITDLLGSKYPEVTQVVNEYFDTSDVPSEDGVSQPRNWLEHNFVGFPMVASLTKLTVMQSDIRSSERNILNTMLQGQLSVDAGVSASTYEPIFMPDKTSFFQGEKVTGKLVLGRYDATLKPSRVTVNGSDVNPSNFVAGKVNLDFSSSSVGDHEIKGDFVFMQDGEEVVIPINQSYFVGSKPSDAVISADKMNVVYRGLPNPMTISVPGVDGNKVNANAPGLKKVKPGVYLMTPSTGREVKINVIGTLPDGEQVRSSKIYRIKDLPTPMATVRKEAGLVKMTKASLEKTTVRVELPDFLFDLEFKVQSFKIKVPGQATMTITGNKLNAQAQSAVKRARVGDMVTIFDVKSSIQGISTTLKVPNAMPVNIEIQ